MLTCSLIIMGGLMLAIVLMKRNMKGPSEQERQKELVQKNEEGTITTEEAAELAKNPPYREDQTIEYEVNRYGKDFRPRAAELVKQFRNKEIDYKTFITELNKVRDMALKAKQYEV